MFLIKNIKYNNLFFNNYIFNISYIKKMDNYIIKNCYNKKGLIKNKIFNNKKIYNYLLYRFVNEKNILNVCKKIYLNIEYDLLCPTCHKNFLTFIGKPSKLFSKYCSCTCAGNSKYNQLKKKETQKKHWGTYNCYDSSTYKEYLKNKIGVEYWTQTNNFKDKRKETLLKKFGTLNMYLIDDIKEKINKTCLEKYGVENPMKNEEIKKKHYLSYKQHKHIISKQEQLMLNYLNELFPNDIAHQYYSEEYPFKCDFYIKSKNIYIEYHGAHFHCGHAYNEKDKKDIEKLNELKGKSIQKHLLKDKENQYDKMIYTWTDLDVRKRKISKENKLKIIFYYNFPTKEKLYEDIMKMCKK